jgi:beta-glucosidase
MDFPKDFIWGTATSSYQIEGAVDEDGRGRSIWDDFCDTPGKIKDGSSGAVACDHYHRYDDDVKLMKSLGFGAYRFSIAWPRILPNGRGHVNGAGVDFYSRLVDALLENGITPFATLYHWDLPSDLQERGGWGKRDTALYFADYATIMARVLGDRVRNWITLNEPWCTAFLSHDIGLHAPGLKNPALARMTAHNTMLAHGAARIVAGYRRSGQLRHHTQLFDQDAADQQPGRQARLRTGR